MLELLLAPGDQALITPIPEHRSWSRDDLAMARPALAAQLLPVAEPLSGLEALISDLASDHDSACDHGHDHANDHADDRADRLQPVVAGSLHLLGVLLPRLALPERP